MAVGSKFALTCAAGVGCAGSIPYVIKYRCSNSKERWVTPEVPFLTCTDSRGTSISLSLAFRNDVGTKDETNASDLYLKGLNLNTKEDVDLYEDLGEDRAKRQMRWQRIIFEGGTHQLHELSGKMDENYDGERFTCRGETFKVVRGKPKADENRWEQALSSITVDPFKDCNEGSGRRVCDIKIADSVGLKWGTNFTPKAHFCKSSK